MQGLPTFVGPAGIDMLLSDSYVSLDFETTNEEKGSPINPVNDLVLACWTVVKDGVRTRKHIWGDEYEMQELLDDIASVDKVIAHNAKFELGWLRRCGLDLRSVLVFDTMLAEWVILGNRKMPLNLEETSKRYGLRGKRKLGAKSIKYGIPTQDIPQSWLLPYCFDDGDLAEQIYLQQRKVLSDLGLWHIALVRMLTCPALADIEFAGCQLDRAKVLEWHGKYVEEYNQIGAELASKFGNINFGSSQQLAKLLFEDLKFSVPRDHKGKPMVTPKGAPKTDAESLSKLTAGNARQQEFLDLYTKYNQLDALLSKNLDFFKGVAEHDDAVFYGILNQGQTGTHRLSSSGRKRKFPGTKKEKGAQLQNMPRSFKELFTAHDEDYVIGEADGAQLEFRVAAEMGHDDVARREIEDGTDIHSVTSEVLINAGHPEFKGLTIKQGRQAAKSRSFAPLYGGMGRGEAEQQYAAFFKQKYHGISSTQRDWCLEVLEHGKLRTPYGMIFYWPGTKMSRSGYIDNSTAIHNYPVN